MRGLGPANIAGWGAGAFSLFVVLGWYTQSSTMWLLALVAGVFAGGYWVWDQWHSHRHGSALKKFALQNGWSYSPGGHGLTAGLSGFPFDVGTNRRAEDVLQGVFSGRRCVTFTYRFEYRSNDDAPVTQIFTITSAEVAIDMRRIDIVPESFGTRMLGGIAGTDIDLESAQFNREWRLLCDDKRYAVDVIDPRMMEMLLRPESLGRAIHIERRQVVTWSPGRASLDDLSRRLTAVCGIAARVPNHVLRTGQDAQRAQEAREANAPSWANTGGILNSGRYTGIGVDSDGDGVEDWKDRTR
jgi:hypothetical protein